MAFNRLAWNAQSKDYDARRKQGQQDRDRFDPNITVHLEFYIDSFRRGELGCGIPDHMAVQRTHRVRLVTCQECLVMLDWSLEADLAEIKELDSGAVASLKDAEEIRKAAIRRHYGT